MVRSLEHGGCERDAAKIAVGLDRSRFEPHVGVFIEGGFRTSEVRAAGAPIVHFPVTSFLNSSFIRGARKLGTYVRKQRIQLIHAFDVPTDIFGAPAAKWYRVPVIITSQLSFRNMYPRSAQAMLRLTDFLSDAVVVNSRAVGDSLPRHPGLPRDKIYLSHNGVEPSHFHPGPGLRPGYLKDATLVVGSVCVMRTEKRMDWLIRSFAAARKIDPGIHLLLVGSGPEIPKLMELRDSLGLHDFCHFEPARADVAQWLQSIDIYVNASSSESFPNALLEAMACGCFPIGSSVGGIPELITHMQDGLIFDSEKPDQLTEMLCLAVGDADLRKRFRERAVMTAHCGFSMQLALERTEELYQRLLERRGVKALSAC